MVNEQHLQVLSLIKVLWAGAFAYLYGRGGVYNKTWRRWIGTAWLTLGVVGVSIQLGEFNPWYLLYYPLLSGALTLPYGADKTYEKVVKRFLFGLAAGVAFLPIVIVNQRWLAFTYYLIIVIFSSVFLGVKNPCRSARDEETLIGAVIGLSLFIV